MIRFWLFLYKWRLVDWTMTAMVLTGFVLHTRPYQEKKAIYAFFCQKHGRIDGVGGRGLPLFVPMRVLMSGKGALKTFKEPFFLTQTPHFSSHTAGQMNYTALYLNELLYKLLPKDDPQPTLWQVYYQTLIFLGVGGDDGQIRCVLRRFEWQLFIALGLPIVWVNDDGQFSKHPNQRYQHHNELGFVLANDSNALSFLGKQIVAIKHLCLYLQNEPDVIDFKGIDKQTLSDTGRLFRCVIDELLDFKPLNSRILYQDQLRLTHTIHSPKKEQLCQDLA